MKIRSTMVLAGSFFCLSTLWGASLPRECNIEKKDGVWNIFSDNGATLAISPGNGKIRSVDGQWIPFVEFEEVIEDENAPELIPANPSFSINSSQLLEDSSIRISSAEDKNGTLSLTINQSQRRPLILSGECSYQTGAETGGWMNRHLALNLTGKYLGGTAFREVSAYFGQYDHSWQFNRKVFCPDFPVESVQVELTASERNNTAALFRNISLKEADFNIFSPEAEVLQRDHRLQMEFKDEANGLQGMIVLRGGVLGIEVDGYLENMRQNDRALSVTIHVPLDGTGGLFYPSLRKSEVIDSEKLYFPADRWYGAGRDGFENLYPFVTASPQEGPALSIGVDPDHPRVFFGRYDGKNKLLQMRFDLGFSSDMGGKWHNRNNFHAVIFGSDSADGMRGAGATYQEIYKWAFQTRRAENEGVWLAFLSTRNTAGQGEGIHFGQVESIGDLSWNLKKNYNSFYYVEPWIHHQSTQDYFKNHQDLTGVGMNPDDAIEISKQVTAEDPRNVPDQERWRHFGYPANYITDNWGKPQGYFFRQAGRKENMMIVDPNLDIAPPDGAVFATGGLDQFIEEEAYGLIKQYLLDDWAPERTSLRPIFEVEEQFAAEGSRSLRIEPILNPNYYEFTKQILHQTTIEPQGKVYTLQIQARGEGGSKEISPAFSVAVAGFFKEDRSESFAIPLENLTSEWQTFTKEVTFSEDPVMLELLLQRGMHAHTDWTVYVDDVKLIPAGKTGNLARNGSFESVEMVYGETTGAYFDTMECYTNNLNYRRSHWLNSPNPLTFDSGREVALHQQYSHVAYVKEFADKLHNRNKLVFANCAGSTPFGAPYIDVFGDEQFWPVHDDGSWSPAEDQALLFRRFITRAKPFNMLQYVDFDYEHMKKYMSRLGFYGIYPSMQGGSAKTGMWYWPNPERAIAHRELYNTFVPVLKTINAAGWQPLTLAESSHGDVILERFADDDKLFLTVYNLSTEVRSVSIRPDERLQVGAAAARELFSDTELPMVDGVWNLTIDGEALQVLQIR